MGKHNIITARKELVKTYQINKNDNRFTNIMIKVLKSVGKR